LDSAQRETSDIPISTFVDVAESRYSSTIMSSMGLIQFGMMLASLTTRMVNFISSKQLDVATAYRGLAQGIVMPRNYAFPGRIFWLMHLPVKILANPLFQHNKVDDPVTRIELIKIKSRATQITNLSSETVFTREEDSLQLRLLEDLINNRDTAVIIEKK
jgi:hypothetical protein